MQRGGAGIHQDPGPACVRTPRGLKTRPALRRTARSTTRSGSSLCRTQCSAASSVDRSRTRPTQPRTKPMDRRRSAGMPGRRIHPASARLRPASGAPCARRGRRCRRCSRADGRRHAQVAQFRIIEHIQIVERRRSGTAPFGVTHSAHRSMHRRTTRGHCRVPTVRRSTPIASSDMSSAT